LKKSKTNNNKKILVVFGTRPEAIKLFPVIKSLKKNDLNVSVCVTSQQKEMLHQVINFFEIDIDHDLKVMRRNQSLFDTTSIIIKKLETVIQLEKPELIICHGDTTSALCASIASFYFQIPLAHVEAGLRTETIHSPFPEEFNRRVISLTASYHFAPTKIAMDNLIKEGISKKNIFITGNTVIDALLNCVQRFDQKQSLFPKLKFMEAFDPEKKIILVTGHRRESFGKGFTEIFSALILLASKFDIEIIYPVHLNPNVYNLAKKMLLNIKNIHLIEPLDYQSFTYLLNQSYIVLTDSGGIQEEAPSLNIPVVVMRESTERPEGVSANTSLLVGANQERIESAVTNLLSDRNLYNKMAKSKNPYGDGKCSDRITKIIQQKIFN